MKNLVNIKTIFAVAALVLSFFLLSAPLNFFSGLIESMNWERVPATIETFQPIHQDVTATYRYTVDGVEYRSSQVDFTPGMLSTFSRLKQVRTGILHRALHEGEEMYAWVNPEDPEEAILFRDADFFLIGLMSSFGFAALFGSILFLKDGLQYSMEQNYRLSRMAYHPDEPWLWTKKWNRQPLRDGNSLQVYVSGFVIVCQFMVMFLMGLITYEVYRFGLDFTYGPIELLRILLGMLPLMILGFLIVELRKVIRWNKFGFSTVTLDTFPVFLGDSLSGTIQTGKAIPAEGPYHIQLKCDKTYWQKSGKTNSEVTTTLWESGWMDYEDTERRSAGRSVIPFEIPLPNDPELTTRNEGDLKHVWKLCAKASAPGVDYHTEIDVPVYARP